MKLLSILKIKHPKIVSVLIQFHHIENEGDLWVDWINELKGGHKRVWQLIAVGEKKTTKLCSLNKRTTVTDDDGKPLYTLGETIQSQIFTRMVFQITNLSPDDTPYQVEPPDPYNILGIRNLKIIEYLGI